MCGNTDLNKIGGILLRLRNITDDDYSYIKAQLTADLSAQLNVYVNCNIDSFSRIVNGNEVHYVKIETFIRKPPK